MPQNSRVIHLACVLRILDDLAVTYSAVMSVSTQTKTVEPKVIQLACRLLKITATLIQRPHVQEDVSTFRMAGKLLITSGNLICDVVHHSKPQNLSEETRNIASFILNTLNTTPMFQAQIEVQQAMAFSKALFT